MVALTGIETGDWQSGSVQLGLSSSVFGPVRFATKAQRTPRKADVLPRCCPAAKDLLIRSAPHVLGSSLPSWRFGSRKWYLTPAWIDLLRLAVAVVSPVRRRSR